MSAWADELHDPILADGHGPLAAFDLAPPPAEACTELGADTAPSRLSPWQRLRLAWLRWQMDCLRDEQALYVETGRAGPIFERECRRLQLDLMRRMAAITA